MQEQEKITYTRRAAIIAAIFTLSVGLLMILNYLQIRSSAPLESKALTMLIERLSADPGNQQLMEEIRQLDLLARKAYFNSIWQIRTGGWLMLFGAIAFIISFRIYLSLRFNIDRPSQEHFDEKTKRIKAQHWILVSGAILLVSATLSALFSINHLKQFDTVAHLTYPGSNGVEQVDIIGRSDRHVPPSGSMEDQDVNDGFDDPVTANGQLSDLSATQEDLPASSETTTATTAVLTAELLARNHNTFRGPWGRGVSAHTNIPTTWDGQTGKNICWRTEVPIHGYNSPVIWNDKIFLSGANNNKRVVYCFNRRNGTLLWEREVANIPGSPSTPPRTTEDTGLAAPSLAVDGVRVFALFGTGDIIAFSLEGERMWARNLGVPVNHYGHSSSLLVWDNKVFVQYDTQEGASVMALDSGTGRTIWETPRSSGVSWASPILITLDGRYHLVLAASPTVAAYDAETGQKRWAVDCLSAEVGPSPAYGSGKVFVANEYAKLVAINAATGEVIWDDNYYLPEVSSPLYHNGLLYIATSYGVFACFDASDGSLLWEFDADNGFYSSPVYADGKIFVVDMGGKTYIFTPGREVTLISSPEIGEKVFATPVFSDGRIYIRGNRHLYCIQ